MRRVLILVPLGMLIAGCVPLGTRTEGTSGPIAWHVTDLKTESVGDRTSPGDFRGAYSFTLVLKETQGIPITFTYRKDTIYATDLTILRSADQAINLRLRPHEERRFPLTFSWGCAAADCLQPRSVAPLWTINLTGSDEKGQAVQVVIQMRLPDNPDTYKPPLKAIKTEGPSPAGGVQQLSAHDYNAQGMSYSDQKKYDAAIESYQKALQVNPNFREAYNNLGNSYREKGMYDDALAAYQRALEISPNYDLAHANLGVLYQTRGRYEEASSQFDIAIKLNPNRAYTHYSLCWTLKEMGKLAEAIEACKKALTVDPSYKGAYRNLGILYKETGKLEDAIVALKKALELDPNYLSAHEQLAGIYQRQGWPDEAKKHFSIIEELRKR